MRRWSSLWGNRDLKRIRRRRLRRLLKLVFIYYFGTSFFKTEIRKIGRCQKTCKLHDQFTSYLSMTQRSVPRIIYVKRAQLLFCSVNVFWWRSRYWCLRVLRKVRKRLEGTAEIKAMKSFFWKGLTWYFMFAVTRSILNGSTAHSTLEILFLLLPRRTLLYSFYLMHANPVYVGNGKLSP